MKHSGFAGSWYFVSLMCCASLLASGPSAVKAQVPEGAFGMGSASPEGGFRNASPAAIFLGPLPAPTAEGNEQIVLNLSHQQQTPSAPAVTPNVGSTGWALPSVGLGLALGAVVGVRAMRSRGR
jgi:hypothetical protein